MTQREIAGMDRSVSELGKFNKRRGINSPLYLLFALPLLVSAEYRFLRLSKHKGQYPDPVLMEWPLIYELEQNGCMGNMYSDILWF